MRARPEPTSAIALSTAVFAVSWAAILIRYADAPSLTTAFWRMALSTAVLMPWLPRLIRRATVRTLGLGFVAGSFLALHFATWITSLEYTTVASSVVLVSTQPVFTAIMGPFLLRERPGALGWIAVALSVGGSAVLAGGDLAVGEDALLGDLLALAGAATAAGYLLLGRMLRDRIDFAPYLLLVNGTAALLLGAACVAGDAPYTGFPARTWLCFVLLAAGPNLTGHGLLNWCVRRMRALTVNLAVLGEPVLSALYAAWLFSEFPATAFYPGAALLAAGIVLAVREEVGRRMPRVLAEPVP